jgi:ankyrin repeat protein
MLAISSGNEKLIESLLKNTVLLTEDVLSYAIDFAGVISYTSLQEIAKAVEKNIGTTGLDTLLESTLLGDSKKALEELEKRENMLMTPVEKLSLFFSAAFSNSEVIGEFIEKGFDINLEDASGKNILDIAEKYGNEENVKNAEKISE